MELTKLEAAARQLNTAIQLFFEGRDAIAVCTLVAAAGRVLSDLVEHQTPNESFRSTVVTTLPHIPRREIYSTIDRIPNFLKHADQDPDGIESFNEAENEHRLFVACEEWFELESEPSVEMQALEIWYAASYPERFDEEIDGELLFIANHCLPNISSIDRATRISLGAAFLAEQRRISESEFTL